MALVALTVGTPDGVAYRVVDEVWERTLEGWDCDYVTDDLPDTLYPTKEACEQAIKETT